VRQEGVPCMGKQSGEVAAALVKRYCREVGIHGRVMRDGIVPYGERNNQTRRKGKSASEKYPKPAAEASPRG
jgi:hypothetical protein